MGHNHWNLSWHPRQCHRNPEIRVPLNCWFTSHDDPLIGFPLALGLIGGVGPAPQIPSILNSPATSSEPKSHRPTFFCRKIFVGKRNGSYTVPTHRLEPWRNPTQTFVTEEMHKNQMVSLRLEIESVWNFQEISHFWKGQLQFSQIPPKSPSFRWFCKKWNSILFNLKCRQWYDPCSTAGCGRNKWNANSCQIQACSSSPQPPTLSKHGRGLCRWVGLEVWWQLTGRCHTMHRIHQRALATGLIECKVTGFQNVPAILVMKIDRLLRQVTTRTSGSIDAALSTFCHINTRTITPIHDESFTTILGFRKFRPDHSWMNSNDFSSNATTFHLPCKHNTCQARIGIGTKALALEGRIRRTIRYGIDVASDPHNALRFQEEIQHVMAQNTSSLLFLSESWWKQKIPCTQKKIRNQTQNMNASKRLGIFPDA